MANGLNQRAEPEQGEQATSRMTYSPEPQKLQQSEASGPGDTEGGQED